MIDYSHQQLDGIYICSDTCGRFDHIIANINTLFKANEYVGDAQVRKPKFAQYMYERIELWLDLHRAKRRCGIGQR